MTRPIHNIMMGGLGGLVPPFYYSGGLRDLSAKLRALSPAIKTTILHHNEDDLAWRVALKAQERGEVINLFGHSLGAHSVLQLAVRLHTVGNNGIKVGLLVAFDDTWNVFGNVVTANVSRCLCFYNRNWLSFLGKKKYVAGPGFKGHLSLIPLAALHQNVEDDLSAQSMCFREVAWQVDPSAPAAPIPRAAIKAESLKTQAIIDRKTYPGDDPRESSPT